MPDENAQRLVQYFQRRLQILREKQAQYGLDAPVQVLTEIEDIEASIAKLKEEQIGPAYKLRVTTPRKSKTVSVSASGYRTVGVTGVVDPVPQTGVWIIRQVTTYYSAQDNPHIERISAFEAEVDNDGVWECKVQFYQLSRNIDTRYKVWAAVPNPDGVLLFRFYQDCRGKIKTLITAAKEGGCELPASYVAFTEETLPGFITQSAPKEVTVRLKKPSR